MVQKISMVLIVLLLAGCSGDQDAETQTGKAQVQQAIIAQPLPRENAPAVSESRQGSLAAYQLIFFLDPNGRPCQMQAHILNGMATDFKDRVDLRYVQTTVAADRDVFYQYGIRSLPTLVLADAAGKEVSRLTPGVKNAEDILRLINIIPGS